MAADGRQRIASAAIAVGGLGGWRRLLLAIAAGALSVLGVMIASGTANEALGPVFDAMPMQEAKEREIEGVTIEPARILPRNRSLFRYFGSLTTPPCSEGVNWLVLKTPVEASPEQIGKFAQAFPGNARPLQELHRRFILHSG